MQNTENISYWEQKTFFKEIDFLVIGAGIVGYSTAIQLRRNNPSAKIVILERGSLPSGASTKNAGFACFGSATEIYDDLQHIPENEVWETVALRWKGLNELRYLIGDEELKLRINGSWDLITEEELEIAEKTRAILPYLNNKIQEITNVPEVYSEDSDVADKFGFQNVITSFRNKLEGQIDTASMNLAFYKKCVDQNIHILFGTEVLSIEEQGSHVEVQTNNESFQPAVVAICTNGFASKFVRDELIEPARAQVLVTKPLEHLPFEGTFHYQCGYYYFRNIDNRILLGGGRNLDFEGETTETISTTESIQNKLQDLLETTILPGQNAEIDHKWAGIMGVGKTKKPIIKACSSNVFCAVRLGGMGVAIGTLVGQELAQLIQNN